MLAATHQHHQQMADSGIDPDLAGLDLESLDPTPDVHALFSYYKWVSHHSCCRQHQPGGTTGFVSMPCVLCLLSHDVQPYGCVCSSLYFDNQLGACSVEWSTKRMTL